MKAEGSGRRRQHSCQTKACIGVIRLTDSMRSGRACRSKFFEVLSWTEAAIGIAGIGICVFLYAESFLTHHETKSDFSSFPGWIGVYGVQFLAGAITLLSVHEANHCWLHLAATLHILAIIGQCIFSLHAFYSVFSGFPPTDDIEGFHELGVTKAHAGNESSLEKTLVGAITTLSLVSIFIGSFLALSTGYSVYNGIPDQEKRKSSTDLKQKPRPKKERKLVKFDKFDPTNVAVNLKNGADAESNRFTSFENYMAAKDESIIYVNRHAQENSPLPL